MTLAQNTLLSTRVLTYFVRIYTTVGTYNGANVLILPNNPTAATGTPGINAIRISKSFDSPVPVCQIDLNRCSSWIKRGMGVTVDVGYNGLTQRLFTGFVQDRGRGIGSGTIICMGRLWTAFRTVQIGQRDVDGVTVSSAIGTILDYVNITDNRSLDIPAFTLGAASSPVLERMPASQMLQMLMDIDGCRIYETGTGQIIIRVVDELPAATSYKTYTSTSNANARILEASDREDPEYYRNRVIVTGATVTEGSAPDETSRTITATATNVGSVLVQPPLPSGTFIDAEYNNHLIDTDTKAASVAIRLLTKFARIPRQIVIEITGDPELELGQTLEFIMPELDLNDRGFISGIEHVIDEHGYITRLTDFRGAGDTGGTLSQNPIAAFTFKSEVEVYGAQTNTVATLDASSSFDPDGTIASYAWSDNQTTTPEISTFTTRFPVVRADTSAWTGSWSVTLTVTDNDGLTGSTTITIPYKNTDAEIVIPAVYAAIDNNASASLDGAVTWKDVSGSTCISVGARPADGVNVGHACFGYSNGVIKRTTDGCATLSAAVYTFPSATAVNDIQWDWRNGNVVYAISENCELAISIDAGVTWGLYGGTALRTTLGLAGALGNKIGLPAGGGVYIFGGNGAGTPLIAYDAAGDNAWVQVIMTGDAVSDFPADATMRIVDYTAGFTQECMILSWASGGGASITAVYTTPTGGAPSRAFTRASTTFVGLKSGRYIVSDNVLIKSNAFYCAFADRSIWSSTDGVAWTETTNVMPVGVTPWHAIGMTGSDVLTGIVGMFSVFMIAASDGLYKWTVGEATASYMRGDSAASTAWPPSAIGKKLSIGASGATSAGGNITAMTLSAATRTNTKLSAAGSWSALVSAATTATKPRIFCLTSTNWFSCAANGGSPVYTKDAGATWTAIAAFTGDAHWFAKDAGGRIWAVTYAAVQTRVYYSDDSGDNWTLNYDTGGNTFKALFIACHPTDQNKIIICDGSTNTGTPASRYTLNRGTSWTQQTGGAQLIETQGGIREQFHIQWLGVGGANGRIVAAGVYGGAATYYQIVKYSDDMGANWTTAYTGIGDQWRGLSVSNTGTKLVIWSEMRSGTYVSKPLVSLNSGQTWALVAPAQTMQDYTGSTTAISYGMAYDPNNDALYISTNQARAVVRLAPVDASGIYSDVTDSIGSTAFGDANLAFIP